MTHPEELLAGLVDGSLSPKERAVVDAHVATCARCSGEVALAARARSALGSLAEVPAPPGIAARALREAGAARAPRRSGHAPGWYRFAGAAAAAAAALLVLILFLPRIGNNASSAEIAKQNGDVTAGSAGTSATARVASALEIQNTNYDNASIGVLAASFATASSGAASSSGPEMAANQASSQQTQKALACITRSAPKEHGQLVRLIQAKFNGSPAFISAFLEGPGANQPPDSVTIWVFSTKSCAILSSSFARL
jgi:anti-sigma factor RsiW